MNATTGRACALRPIALAANLLGLVLAAAAQTPPPDAGRTLQQLQPAPTPPREAPALRWQPLRPGQAAAPGGPTVTLRALRFSGHTAFDSDALAASLADAIGREFDLAGLQALAERIAERYRDIGQPFVRALLPPQDLAGGELHIRIVEARYGALRVQADDPAVVTAVEAFLAPLRPGALIESAALERATLLVDDLPGLRSEAVLSPGAEVGTGDLTLQIERARPFHGELAFDNHGNRYSGRLRLRARGEATGLLRPGDRADVDLLASDQDLVSTSAGYGLPLNGQGTRLQAGLARTRYQLGAEFEALGASGHARVATLGLSHPVQRSIRSNLTLQLELQHKSLDDRQASVGSASGKRSQALPVTLRFDRRDEAGAGLVYGQLVLTSGRLRLDAAGAAADLLRTQGAWQTARLDLTRLQPLPAGWTLAARLQGQWADRNLDSSEGFSLGGAAAVRAYPTGEAPGDAGWLTQIELRRPVGAWTPFAFHDQGRVQVDVRPAAGQQAPSRRLAGAGLGLRGESDGWRFEAQLAWRTAGGVPQSDGGRDARPRAWVSASYRF